MKIVDIYDKLLNEFGPQGWWPSKTRTQYEVAIGALLTQNTNWKNVEKALDNLIAAKLLSAQKIADMKISELQKLVKPSGFYKQKAKRVQDFSRLANDRNFFKNVTREELLGLNGIGPETADSIMLYACNRLYFPVDAYTKRIFTRLGLLNGKEDYEEIRSFFEFRLPKNLNIYKEYHALIVKLAKESCKAEPVCKDCVLEEMCKKLL